MNEEHIIAAILTAGLLAQNKDGSMQPSDATDLYTRCLAELIEMIRPAARANVE